MNQILLALLAAALVSIFRLNYNRIHFYASEIIKKCKPGKKEEEPTIHMLIEKGLSFTDEIRTRVLNLGFDIKIIDLFDEDQGLSYYIKGWRDFVYESESKWLITIYPEEPGAYITPKVEKELLGMMEKKGKTMICIESGHKLQQMSKSVYVISTDHENAMRELLSAMARKILKKEKQVHFVLLPGPKANSSANQRRTVQVEYLAWLIYQQNIHSLTKRPKNMFDHTYHKSWTNILSYTDDNVLLRISILPESSWYREDAIKIVTDSIDALDIVQNNVHTCFLCGNDDLALGALDAVKNWTRKESIGIEELNISFFGFDGSDEMTELIAKGGKGGTMKVRFDSICEEIKNIYLEKKKFKRRKVRKVDADLKIE